MKVAREGPNDQRHRASRRSGVLHGGDGCRMETQLKPPGKVE
jgi:hypothetical protein